jgi:hypothetical protein
MICSQSLFWLRIAKKPQRGIQFSLDTFVVKLAV